MSYGKKKDGRWYVKYKINGKAKWEYFGRGLAAEKMAADRNEELKDSGKIQEYNRREATIQAPVFFELANEYLKIKSATDLTVSTINATTYKLESIIVPEIGQIEVTRLTHARLDQYVQKRLSTPVQKRTGTLEKPIYRSVKNNDGTIKLISRSTVHRELSIIQAILNWGVKKKYILTNPVRGHEKPKRDDAIIKPPTIAETKLILKHASDHLIRALYISFYTGLRPGLVEQLILTWDMVDFEGKTIFIVSAKKNGPVSRTIPLHKNLLEKLIDWKTKDDSDPRIKSNFIINYKNGPVKSVSHGFQAAKRRAKITRRLRLYDFRHASISMMLEAGADLKSVSEIAGHSRTDTTTKIYQHTNQKMLRNQIDLIPDL